MLLTEFGENGKVVWRRPVGSRQRWCKRSVGRRYNQV